MVRSARSAKLYRLSWDVMFRISWALPRLRPCSSANVRSSSSASTCWLITALLTPLLSSRPPISSRSRCSSAAACSLLVLSTLISTEFADTLR